MGINAFLISSETVDLNLLHNQLKEINAIFDHRLIWPLLVEAIEDKNALEEQPKIEERYSLE
ncbi:hypothetical protein H0A36_12120 [Endozoicomonas sp. SM1973]|uniref:Uncharacterized protein n=1 Tax=Spartinivicinus marinus TaxID=2994442 RepID=A0A853IB42_9GAMM|nr:hypothetical protein [Spartinivicinus marinus]MCX4026898.1 hypothetical protein [Spartinivicinus marinus]NYZ66757.1 hypothetical protein [Spartinivicinus marinus]